MSDVRQVTRDNLGSGFLVDEVNQKINVLISTQERTIYSEEVKGGDNGVNGSDIWATNCTVTRTAEGRYQVRFDTVHPDGDEYNPQLTGHEDGNRDAPKVWVVQGTKNASGFDVAVTVDDNGAGADNYEDNGWSFSVSLPVEVITGVSVLPLVTAN